MEDDHLPPFLTPLAHSTASRPRQAVFNHPSLGPAHSLWWNSQNGMPPEAVLVFIPGNPGILDFYTAYLTCLHQQNPNMAIFGHAHLAHTPTLAHLRREYGLRAQVQSAIEAIDAVRNAFGKVKIVLSSHSVGSWIALQVLKARPTDVAQALLLCPTVTHIADTPNGRRLSWVFRSPFPWITSWLSYLTRPLCLSMLFPHWPVPQISALRSLLNSPPTVFACLTMAHEEMEIIRELDASLLDEHKHLLYIYFATDDGWVAHHKATILRAFVEEERAVQGSVPHAFSINHSEQVASQCSLWLGALGLGGGQ
ncbi:hypothetical protein GGX14DRAFT_421782 [Mycena pura]|uniref:Uncharacterized protein n=1 Tax=Mycena pura TaxID=153505 RepID=A0AAD6YPU3_9AGAR|nr:hypothetical protein GGX14DRAFT_421782 [Mycena pura]